MPGLCAYTSDVNARTKAAQLNESPCVVALILNRPLDAVDVACLIEPPTLLRMTESGMKWEWTSTIPGIPNRSTIGRLNRRGQPPSRDGQSHRLRLPLCVALRDRLPLVVRLSAACEAVISTLRTVFEVERQRNESESALLRLSDELRDLIAVQQQFAFAPRLVIRPRALGVLGM